ncbi:hypothetical protein SAMN05216264_12073, partial [Pseudomonas marincola]
PHRGFRHGGWPAVRGLLLIGLWFLNAGAKPEFVLFLRHLFALTASYCWHTSATRVPQANQKDLPLHWASLCSASRISSLLRGHVAMGRPWPNATLAASLRLDPLRNDCIWPAGMGRLAVSGLDRIGWGLLVFGLLVIGFGCWGWLLDGGLVYQSGVDGVAYIA